MIFKAVKEFLEQFPLLNGKKIGVQALGDQTPAYALKELPEPLVIKQYTDGSAVKQRQFLFESREAYGSAEEEPDGEKNLASSLFYEQLTEWIAQQSGNGTLPNLGEGRESIRMEIVKNSALVSQQENQANYQIQLVLVYFERRM